MGKKLWVELKFCSLWLCILGQITLFCKTSRLHSISVPQRMTLVLLVACRVMLHGTGSRTCHLNSYLFILWNIRENRTDG